MVFEVRFDLLIEYFGRDFFNLNSRPVCYTRLKACDSQGIFPSNNFYFQMKKQFYRLFGGSDELRSGIL